LGGAQRFELPLRGAAGFEGVLSPSLLFETWVNYLKMAIRDTYGPNAISDLTNGHPEFLDVPDQRHVSFLHLRQRVSEVIDREMRVIKRSRVDLDRLQ
jgi:hypothetical protein